MLTLTAGLAAVLALVCANVAIHFISNRRGVGSDDARRHRRAVPLQEDW